MEFVIIPDFQMNKKYGACNTMICSINHFTENSLFNVFEITPNCPLRIPEFSRKWKRVKSCIVQRIEFKLGNNA